MHPAPERKLTTILAADVAGYSAMMGRDEAGTLAQLKISREAMAKEIDRYRGRVVGTSGDSLLAEFSSVVNAVECAVRVQREFSERNATLPEEKRMRFRIGINLGDVMVEGDDLFGEGVNIAARLEALAEPGGILISGTVFDQVRSKLSLGFDFLGAQPVKNISEPVPTWRVVLDREAAPPLAERAGEGESLLGRFVTEANRAGRQPGDPPLVRPEAAGDTKPRKTTWQRVKRSATFAGVLIGFLFLVNMFSWEGELWFQWPTLVILFILGLRVALAMGQ